MYSRQWAPPWQIVYRIEVVVFLKPVQTIWKVIKKNLSTKEESKKTAQSPGNKNTQNKSLAQEVRQKSDISEHRNKAWKGLPYFVCNTVAGSPCDLSGVILLQKWIQPFLSEIRCWIFFYATFFSKKAVSSEKTVKHFFSGAFDNFTGKKGRLALKINVTFLSQMRCWIFYYLAVYPKKAVFFEKTAKNRYWGPSLFWREGDVWRGKLI